MNSRHLPARTEHRDPSSHKLLLNLVEHLPPHARRLIVTGDHIEGIRTPFRLLQSYVATLRDYNWTEQQIYSLFFSDLPLDSIKVFHRHYGQGTIRAKRELQKSIYNARPTQEGAGYAYPLLLDPTCWRRKQEPVPARQDTQISLKTDKIALKRLATFAYDMYTGKHEGHYVCTLPIGYGKTKGFLLPFVIQCITQDPSTGIIVAVERKEQVKDYAKQVNKDVRRKVAFPLMGHDSISCPFKAYNPISCAEPHKRYAERAREYPILFLTHTMLALTGAQPHQEWTHGKRVMVIIDEKPAAWWGKGSIAEHHLMDLQNYLANLPEAQKQTKIYSVISEVKAALYTQQPGAEIQLSNPLTRNQLVSLLLMLPPVEDDPKSNVLHVTLENLYSVGHSKGALTIEEHKRQIIVARQIPLPSLPTLILDATGEYDPEYPAGISVLDIDPWDNRHPPERHIHLETWDTNLTKGTPETDLRWELLFKEIAALLSKVRSGKVYIVCAQIHEETIKTRLKACLSHKDFVRLLFNHYGNTKGSNAMRTARAIVFASVQFKPDAYYHAIALATGKEAANAKARVVARRNRRFTDVELEAIKIRDTVVTLTQEIGRTSIRNDKACSLRVLLPWSDAQGVAALRDELKRQFHATIEHTELSRKVHKSHLDALLASVAPGKTCTRQKVAEQMKSILSNNMQKRPQAFSVEALRKWLNKKDNKRELWGREIEWDIEVMGQRDRLIHVPLETQTEAILAQARKRLHTPIGAQYVPQTKAA